VRRGEVWYANLNPPVGSEAAKRRPVLVVSNDANNRASATVTVVPISSQVARVYPFEVALRKGAAGLAKPSKAQAQQMRTISRERIAGKRLGALSAEEMTRIDAALRLHLSL
jgi:mRNA interferase MazF